MTVRDICTTLIGETEINLIWDDTAYPFSPRNEFMMDAFGGYVVSTITPIDCDKIEIGIKTVPLRAGQ